MITSRLERTARRFQMGLPEGIRSILFAILFTPFISAYVFYDAFSRKDSRVYRPLLSRLPGVSATSSLKTILVSLGYLGGTLVFAAALSHFFVFEYGRQLTDRHIAVSFVSAVFVVISVWLGIALALAIWGKQLTTRLVISVVFGIIILSVVGTTFGPLGSSTELIGWSKTTAIGVAFVHGGVVGNSYIVKYRETKRRQKQRDSRDAESHTYSNPGMGSAVDDSIGHEMLETLTAEQWDVPDDILAESRIEATTRYVSYRNVLRYLTVEETQYEKEVPKPSFGSRRSELREDIDERKQIAPNEFTDESYEYLIPGSIDEKQCTECAGQGYWNCRQCHGEGLNTCGQCSGEGINHCSYCSGSGTESCRQCRNGRQQCSKCGGSGRRKVKETCGNCRGDGETKQGFECQHCSGYGTIKKEKRCSNCKNGEVTCGACSGEGIIACQACNGEANWTCGNCRGRGNVECGNCSGTGEVSCEMCERSGRRVAFETLERTYSAGTQTTYEPHSVPESVLETAEGELIDTKTDDDPDQSGVYRKEQYQYKILTDSTIFQFAQDRWEIFRVEDTIQTIDLPKDFEKQTRVISLLAAVSLPTFLLLYLV